MMLSIKPWPLVRQMINDGAKGVYIHRDGWLTVQLPDVQMEAEFPDKEEFDALPPEMRVVFNSGWAEEFLRDYASRLIKSEKLSNQ